MLTIARVNRFPIGFRQRRTRYAPRFVNSRARLRDALELPRTAARHGRRMITLCTPILRGMEGLSEFPTFPSDVATAGRAIRNHQLRVATSERSRSPGVISSTGFSTVLTGGARKTPSI